MVVRTRRPVSMFDEMDRMLDSMFDNAHSFGKIGSLSTRNPAVDVTEHETLYRIEAELPGLDESLVDIKVEDGVLTLSTPEKILDANLKAEDSEQPRYLIRERRSVHFNRSFVLPKDVDREGITAHFSKGLLTLTLPKQEKALPRKIEIKTT